MHFWQEHHGSNVEVSLSQYYWQGWVYNIVKVVSAGFPVTISPQMENAWHVAWSLQDGGRPQPLTGCRRHGAHRIEDPLCLACRPWVGQRPGGGTASQLSHTCTQEPAHRPRRRLQWQGPNRAPGDGPKAQSPAHIQRPKVLGGRHLEGDCVSSYYFSLSN